MNQVDLSTISSGFHQNSCDTFDFFTGMTQGTPGMMAADQRTRLIAEIANLLNDGGMPADARDAGLTLIGWLARRMPGEPPSRDGIEEMHRRANALQREGGRRP